MMDHMTSIGGGASSFRPPFTAAQWEELEHQALIFKYLKAGVPIPPDLVVSVRKSLDSVSAKFFHQPSLGYFSFYGKKMDPEPGRCRRTDGKKWRCAKDAYPDSKYCERHMHRSRNRSRKPVESQTNSQSSSSMTSSSVTGSSSSSGSFQNPPFHYSYNPEGHCFGNNVSHLQMEHKPHVIDNKMYRYGHGMKLEAEEHKFIPEASGSAQRLRMDPSLDHTWRLMPSQVLSNPLSKAKNDALLHTAYSQLHTFQDYESLQQQHQQQHVFFGGEFGSHGPGSGPAKQDQQSLRPFFDEWPKTRNLWSDMDDQSQPSISIPISPSAALSAPSPSDDCVSD